jgi:hypothetical protein
MPFETIFFDDSAGTITSIAPKGINVSIPETMLLPGDYVPLGNVWLNNLETLEVNYLNLCATFLQLTNPALPTQRIHSGLGIAYLGVYRSQDASSGPNGVPLAWVGVDTVGFNASWPYAPGKFSTPGMYAVLLVNNTQGYLASLTAGVSLMCR